MLTKADIRVTWRPEKSKEGRWEVSLRWNGRLYRYYSWDSPSGYVRFTKENYAWALALKQFIRARLVPNEDGIIPWEPAQIRTGHKRVAHVFKNYIKVWLDEYREFASRGRRSVEYCRHLDRYARLWWNPKLGNLHIREINKTVLKEFWLHLCQCGLSDKYIKNIMDGLKKALTDFYEDEPDKCPRFPAYGREVQQKKVITRILTEEEQDYVLSFVPEVHKPIVRFYLYHGTRMGEARALMRRDVDLKKGIAIIRTLKRGPDRWIWLEPAVIEDMKNMPSALHGRMFHHNGRPYSKTTFWKIIRKALDAADFEDVSPYAAGRHSFAAIRSAKGQPSLDLQFEMGYADIRTTQRYYHRLQNQKKWCRNGVAENGKNTEED